MYGDGSGVSVSVLTFEDDPDRDWDDELDKITDYYYENYKDFMEFKDRLKMELETI